jgi:hypothetical protein
MNPQKIADRKDKDRRLFAEAGAYKSVDKGREELAELEAENW